MKNSSLYVLCNMLCIGALLLVGCRPSLTIIDLPDSPDILIVPLNLESGQSYSYAIIETLTVVGVHPNPPVYVEKFQATTIEVTQKNMRGYVLEWSAGVPDSIQYDGRMWTGESRLHGGGVYDPEAEFMERQDPSFVRLQVAEDGTPLLILNAEELAERALIPALKLQAELGTDELTEEETREMLKGFLKTEDGIQNATGFLYTHFLLNGAGIPMEGEFYEKDYLQVVGTEIMHYVTHTVVLEELNREESWLRLRYDMGFSPGTLEYMWKEDGLEYIAHGEAQGEVSIIYVLDIETGMPISYISHQYFRIGEISLSWDTHIHQGDLHLPLRILEPDLPVEQGAEI